MMSYFPFLIAALALAITPGPGITYVVARTVSGGRTEGLASCVGTAIGGLLHVVASSLGLSVLIAKSAILFSLLKYLGAAYLIYLGIRLLLSKGQDAVIEPSNPQGPRRALIEGIVVEALNVKTALFFLAFLPQFVRPDSPVITQLIVMGIICVTLNTLADAMAVIGAHRLLDSPVARAAKARWMTRASGVTMLGLGAYLAAAERN
jgi:threonine/homoserine/homoserine lactone efflux protein